MSENESLQPGASEALASESTTSDAGKQGSSRSTQARPGTPTNEILNADGIAIAWDVIEDSARRIGIPKTATEYKIEADAIRTRSRRYKWKKIPHAATLAKRNANSDALVTMTGDLASVIDRHRATVFEKTSKSIAKFRAKAPKNFREFDAADKIARRALGIDEDKPAQQSVLIQINEAIGEHEAPVPVEAHEVFPCNPEPMQLDNNEAGNQGSSEPAPPPRTSECVTPPLESDAPKETANDHPVTKASTPFPTNSETGSHSLTLNAGDSSRRQFVLP
jgi:hypothetical protein